MSTVEKRMPQSLVLNLVACSAIPQKSLQGRAIQHLFFDLVNEVDPDLAHVLRQDPQSRAYSLSALQGELQVDSRSKNLRLFTAKHNTSLQFFHQQAIAPNTPCWWRITFLDDDLFDHLIFLWKDLVNEPFQLGSSTVAIANVIADMPHVSGETANWPGMSWASSCSYRDLYEEASAYEQDVHMQFLTPTAFEEDGSISPMPTAEAVFHPLRKCWNRYSGLAFAPNLIKNIVPLRFDIKTETLKPERALGAIPSALFPNHPFLGVLSGCVGKVSFRIVGNDPLTNKRINALADFARYCGIGYGAPVGMGSVRRLSGSSMKAHRSKNRSKIRL